MSILWGQESILRERDIILWIYKIVSCGDKIVSLGKERVSGDLKIIS